MSEGPRRGRMVVISGPSGSGKSTLARRILTQFPSFRFSISATTRPPRPHERDGIDYHFVSPDSFREMRERGDFLECAEVHGNLYGTLVSTLDAALEAGQDLLFDVDVVGAASIKGRYPGALTLFVAPPSRETLASRLKGRRTDADTTIEQRIRNAEAELARASEYDHVIVNDDLELAARQLFDLIRRLGRGTDVVTER